MGDSFHDNNLVICQPNGDAFKPDSFSLKWRRFIKSKGLKKIRLHDLRHTNATLMLMSGVSAKAAQERLGHADYSTTMNIYSHVLASVEHEAAMRIDNAIFSKCHA